jgi:hypothetical protein
MADNIKGMPNKAIRNNNLDDWLGGIGLDAQMK